MRNEADMVETTMAMEGVKNEDAKLLVKFYMRPIQDMNKTLEAGRPIFVDTEMVRIMVPGDKENIIDREASQIDKRRFAASYAAFKQGDAEQVIGTPLESWPLITRSLVEELRYFNIRTVEQLANLRDDVAHRMMNGVSMKQSAAAFLLAAKESAPIARMTEELRQRDETITRLQKAHEELSARVAAMDTSKK